MCCFRSRKVKSITLSAGVVFTDETLLLCGYQPYKAAPCISGIGGSCEPGEDVFTCAIREMIEELFEIKYMAPGLIRAMKEIAPRKVFTNQNYHIIMYSFEDLDMILKALANLGLQSPLYSVFPTTLHELLFTRNVGSVSAEISHLALLPIVHHTSTLPFVDAYLISDMKEILARRKKLTE